MVQGVLVNVNSSPPAQVLLIDWYNTNTRLTLQMGFKGTCGPWFVDKFVFSFDLPSRILVGEVEGPVCPVQSTE